MKYFFLIIFGLFPFVGESQSQTTFTAETVEGVVLSYIVTAEDQVSVRYGDDMNLAGTVTIPSEVEYQGCKYAVVSISPAAFSNCKNLDNIIIPNSVAIIAESAFLRCTGLTNIEIPNGVTYIGAQALYGCTGLTSIEIPNSVRTLGNNLFQDCTNLTTVKIGSGVTNASNDIFYGCSKIEKLELNCKIIGSWFSASRYSIKEVVLGEGVTTIGSGAFQYFTGLTNIVIPNSVTKIGGDAFYYCIGLTSIEIPNSVTTIGERAFYGCYYLTNITIGNSVTTIGERAFDGCTRLTSIEIPNSVTTLGNNLFQDCTNLTTVKIGSGVTNIGNDIFYRCSKIAKLDINCKTIGTWFSGARSSIKEIVLGDNVTTIGMNAFSACIGLTSIEIPNSVTTIEDYAFSSCSGLTNVKIGSGVTSVANKVFYNCENIERVELNCKIIGSWFSDAKSSIKEVVLGDNVTTVGNSAFSGYRFTSIVISNGVKIIEEKAFYSCRLTSIEIPNSVTYIGGNAFSYCDRLTSVEIPNSVTTIKDYAFSYCRELTDIKIGSGLTTVGEKVFEGCSKIEKLNINCKTINSWFSDVRFSIKEIVLGDNVTTIGMKAFSGCIGLTSIEIPNSVTTIGRWAFEGCTELRNLKIGSGITEFNADALISCGVRRLEINCKNIGYNWFGYARGVEEVVLGDSVTTVGNAAFSGFSKLLSIEIPSNVTYLGENAFSHCSSLSTVYARMKEPVAISANTFMNISDNCVLYVPYTKVDKYKNDEVWGTSFSEIYESSPQVGDVFTAQLNCGKGTIKTNVYVTNENPLEVEIDSLLSPISAEYEKLSIPATFRHKRASFLVTGLGESAFEKLNIKQIILPEGIRYINDKAFNDCHLLEKINIPKSVKYIGNAFQGCDSLDEIYVNYRNPSDLSISNETLSELFESVKLYVPGGTYERYASHEILGNFKQIIETTPVFVGDIICLPNSTAYMPIYLNNDVDIAGLQFRLTLPDGVQVYIDDKSELSASTTDRTDGVTIIGNKEPETDNSYLFVALSLEGDSFRGKEGAVMNIELCADDIPLGVYDVSISDVYLSTSLLETQYYEKSNSEISIVNFIPGDCNNDGRLSVVDISMIINDILKKDNVDFNSEAADINKDERISIVDATMVTNLILEK